MLEEVVRRIILGFDVAIWWVDAWAGEAAVVSSGGTRDTK